eukprot:GHVN01047998.1.p1 GENE.GHVN01047998.1~~GHVN01047998.1.p1  ORF type:complete len:119 (+),score=25.98 GHVN01047998.1:63-419(+)
MTDHLPRGGANFTREDKERWTMAAVDRMSGEELEFFSSNPNALELLFSRDPTMKEMMDDLDRLIKENQEFGKETKCCQDDLISLLHNAEEEMSEAHRNMIDRANELLAVRQTFSAKAV